MTAIRLALHLHPPSRHRLGVHATFESDILKSKSGPAGGNRKWLGFLGILLTLALCDAVVAAQQQAKISRLAYLSAHSPGTAQEMAFRDGLRRLGYVEGKNINFESRYAHDKLDQLPALARELVLLKP